MMLSDKPTYSSINMEPVDVVYECQLCCALVLSQKVHTEWHALLHSTSLNYLKDPDTGIYPSVFNVRKYSS